MLKPAPLVSVVIPVWNAENNISKLVRRLLGQTYHNLEIIAVDDGSSDDSLRVLQDLAQTDTRLKVIHQENAGASAARNAGMRAATGEYLIFTDADDDVTADFVEKLVERLSRPGVAIVATGIRFNKLRENCTVDAYTSPRRARRKGERRTDYLLELLILDGRMYGAVNKIFCADIIKQFGIEFEIGRDFAEDTKFVLDYLEHAPGEIGFILEPLYIYNFGTETSTVRASSTLWQNWQKSYDDLKSWARKSSGGKLHLKTRVLLELVRLRWRVSHYRARKRASSTTARRPA